MKTIVVLTMAFILITLLSACAGAGHEGGHGGGHGCGIMDNKGNEKSSNPLPLIPEQSIKAE